MDTDLVLVAGLGILMLSIPSVVAAFAERRRPWVGLFVIIVGATVVGLAWQNHPGGYTLAEVPEAIIRVVARIIP